MTLLKKGFEYHGYNTACWCTNIDNTARNTSHVYEEHVSEAASKEIKVISHCLGVQSRTHATSLIYLFAH